jgi:LuxR family transcriptional regulator, maltose regulon positive regulatory protein
LGFDSEWFAMTSPRFRHALDKHLGRKRRMVKSDCVRTRHRCIGRTREGAAMTVQLLERPRLVEMLATRWHRRAVTLVAGPGFGKSVLLAQAIAENNLAPQGVDVFLACTEADRAPARLLRRIMNAAGIEPAPGARLTVPEVLAELARRWPLGSSLILDDAHHVLAGDDGARALIRLVHDAPPPVHVVLATRHAVRGLAELRVADELYEIGEGNLALSQEEVARLAALHDVDPLSLAAAGGWPAVTTLAATYGVDGADEYVFDAVLAHLGADERKVLAIASAIGDGERKVLQAAVGKCSSDAIEVLRCLPLVSVTDRGRFSVHDLWKHVIDGIICSDELHDAVRRAVDALIERHDFDRAFRLCAAHDEWDRAASVVSVCCRRGHADIHPDVVAGWIEALPTGRRGAPDGLLLRGLERRINDPFGRTTSDLLARAVCGFRAVGDVAGEIAAGVELVYVLRNQGRLDELPVFFARAIELDAAGHPEAAGPAALARALLAEVSGDDRTVMAALDSIPAGSLSRDWQTVVAFRRAIGALVLGDETTMITAATRCADLAGATSDRHVLALARWFAADPQPCLDTCDQVVADASCSGVDAVLLGTMATMVLASAGRTAEAARQLAATERAAGGPVGPLMLGALVGVRTLLSAAIGDDDGARLIVKEALADRPLSDPVGWRMATRWLPLAYVLDPSIRDELDARTVGPIHERRLAVARAVVCAQEDRPLVPLDPGDISPPVVATSLPLPWAMILASSLTMRRAPEGPTIARYLIELYGDPARDALRIAMHHSVSRVADGARKLLASIAVAPSVPVRVGVLGPIELTVGDAEPTSAHWKRERVRSLLLYLVIHGPTRREQVIDALWPTLDLCAADRNLRVTLTYLNQVLEPGRSAGEASFFVRQDGALITLAESPQLVIDLHEFDSLLDRAADAEHRGLPSVELDLYERALALWRSPCLPTIGDDDWGRATCRDLTERYVAAAIRVGELHLAGGRTRAATHAARRALAADEWSERSHCILIAVALARGDQCGAFRALAACDAMLEDFGVTPREETEMLRRRLGARTPRRNDGGQTGIDAVASKAAGAAMSAVVASVSAKVEHAAAARSTYS